MPEIAWRQDNTRPHTAQPPPEEIARLAGRTEAVRKRGDMARFLVEFEERIIAWRQP